MPWLGFESSRRASFLQRRATQSPAFDNQFSEAPRNAPRCKTQASRIAFVICRKTAIGGASSRAIAEARRWRRFPARNFAEGFVTLLNGARRLLEHLCFSKSSLKNRFWRSTHSFLLLRVEVQCFSQNVKRVVRRYPPLSVAELFSQFL